jgi:hypothetical protein
MQIHPAFVAVHIADRERDLRRSARLAAAGGGLRRPRPAATDQRPRLVRRLSARLHPRLG